MSSRRREADPVAAPDLAPAVGVRPAVGETRALALVLHGGREHSLEPAEPAHLAAVRMRPFATAIHRAGRDRGLTVWSLRYRYRGWNGELQSPVADTRWALDEVRRRHGDVPIVLIGHSMGGRTALHVADDRSVVGVCALAPWIERADSAQPLAGKALLIIHGSNDRTTSPRRSAGFARAAEQTAASVEYVRVAGGHAMLVRAGRWHRLATEFTLRALAPTLGL